MLPSPTRSEDPTGRHGSKGNAMKRTRPNSLIGAPLQYAPQNELGVVFLFARVAPRLQFRIEQIRPRFPDCIAYKRTGDHERLVRVEFEFRSSSFRAHGHDPRQCDCIVCWHHDWPDCPDRIEVIELKKYFHSVPKVWIQPARQDQWHWLEGRRCVSWGLSKRATIGDLLLIYRCRPDKAIRDIYTVVGEMERGKADWRKGDCYAAQIKRLCTLGSPVFLEDFRNHRILRTAWFVRTRFQGNLLVSEYWPYIYDMIVARNPQTKKALWAFDPETM
jgi:hypothetical protein